MIGDLLAWFCINSHYEPARNIGAIAVKTTSPHVLHVAQFLTKRNEQRDPMIIELIERVIAIADSSGI